MIRVGVHLPHFGPIAGQAVLDEAVAVAERAGFDTAWVSDHVAIPVGFETPYPYTASGGIGLPAEEAFIDPFVALSYAAGRTERIRLGISALVLPYRHPALTAKLIGSLDELSRGRARIVIGAGWLREEFDALGADFSARGRVTDEYADAVTALLAGGVAGFDGSEVAFPPIGVLPRPRQQPFPILVGGHSRVAMRRALRLGHGWQATPEQPGEVARMVARLVEEAAGELPAGFVVATRLHLPRFDAGDDGATMITRMRDAITPEVSDLTISIFDRDGSRFLDRLGAVARWLELDDGTTEVLG